MKNIIILLATCILICSCGTSTQVTILGQSGTGIYAPSKSGCGVGEKLGNIGRSGQLRVMISDDVFYPYLLSKSQSDDVYVPFALDYQTANHVGAHAVQLLGETITGIGLGGSIFGGVMYATGDKDLGGYIMMGGGLTALLGVGIGVPAMARNSQTAYENRYQYLDNQHTNQDIAFTKPVFEEVKSERSQGDSDTSWAELVVSAFLGDESAAYALTNIYGDTTFVKDDTSSASNKKLSVSTSNKVLKDNATKIEGNYIGTGKLTQNNSVIEEYSKITITVKKKNSDAVLVNVVESDGSKFFNSDGEYNITKQSNGKYALTLNGIKNASIEIDTNNNMVYIHPRVNIQGAIYTLSIQAKKQ